MISKVGNRLLLKQKSRATDLKISFSYISKCSRLRFSVDEMRALMVVLTTGVSFLSRSSRSWRLSVLRTSSLPPLVQPSCPQLFLRQEARHPAVLCLFKALIWGSKVGFGDLDVSSTGVLIIRVSIIYLFIYTFSFFSDFFPLFLSISTYCCLLLSSHNYVKFLFINMYSLRHCIPQ